MTLTLYYITMLTAVDIMELACACSTVYIIAKYGPRTTKLHSVTFDITKSYPGNTSGNLLPSTNQDHHNNEALHYHVC